MTPAQLEQRMTDVAAASAAVLAERWPALATMGARRRYAALRLHVEAALTAFLDVPGADDPLWPSPRVVPEPSRN